MKTKLFSIILMLAVVLICLIALPTEASAAEIGEGGTFDQSLSWTLNDEGTLTISGSGAMRNYDYEAQSPWYAFREEIKHVVIEEGITRIGVNAFYGCSNLASISIPDSVTSIADQAFRGCTSLTNITLPDSINRICANAFRDCTSLTSINIPAGVTSIDNGTFYGCSSLADITIPDSVTKIRDFAFYGCSSLTGITIPDSVTAIGNYTFEGCKVLANVTYCGTEERWSGISIDGSNEYLLNATLNYHSYTDGVCTICGDKVAYTITFKNWNGNVISSRTYHWGDAVTVPANPTRAADETYTYTFAGWDKDVVACAGDATYTATYSKSHVNYTVVFKDWNGDVISSNTYHWGDAVTVPANPTRAADETYTYTFAGWDKEVVACAGNATYTATYSKSHVNYTVVFKDWNGDVISSNTYYWGDAVTVPANPTRAADETYTYTFAGWGKEVVHCVGNATYTATYSKSYINYTVVFKNWDGTVLSSKTYHWGDEIAVPADPTKAADDTYTYTFAGWDKEVVACTGDATYTAIYTRQRKDGLLYSIEGGQVTITGYAGSGDTLIIPGTIEGLPVVGIGSSAFSGCTSLTRVTISNSVVSIGENAFDGCTSLKNVTIPASVAAIGHSAFLGTPWYTAKIAESGQWLIVGDGVLLKYSGTGATEVTVPDSVKYISDAFRGNTKLIKIIVKSTCKVIGQYAFADCPKLHTIGLPMKLDYIASNSVVGCPTLQVIKNIDDNPADPQPINPTDSEPTVQPKPEGVTPASVKVMSWNVWHENVWEGQCTNWDRLERVVKVVEHYSPDVFMTQETTDWFVIYLMQNLPSQYTWAYTHSNGHDTAMPELPRNNKHADETHSAIFYNQEKLELLDNGVFWLSETPNVMSKYYESYCFRIVSWAKFRDIATGREFICTNVHLDGDTDEPFKVLMDFVNKNIGTPTILAGDFNRKKTHAIIKSLNAYAPLKDASQAAPQKLTESANNLDWVFVSRNTVDVLTYKHGLVDGIENPSDHKPRVVELLIY